MNDMAERGLLILPDVSLAPGQARWPIIPVPLLHSASATSRQVSLTIGLPATQFATAHSRRQPADTLSYSCHYTHGRQPAPPGEQLGDLPLRRTGVLPIPPDITTTQATLDGPSLEIRRSLVQAALAPTQEKVAK